VTFITLVQIFKSVVCRAAAAIGSLIAAVAGLVSAQGDVVIDSRLAHSIAVPSWAQIRFASCWASCWRLAL
jgi:hypothetical protein